MLPTVPAADIAEFEEALARGVHAALRFLNGRTPHRFTGLYRYRGDTLESVVLFDRYDPDVQRGGDRPLAQTWCALLGRDRPTLTIANARTEKRFVSIEAEVVSYCGTLIPDGADGAVGTLCHFDTLPCEQRTSDIPLLEAVAPLLRPYVEAG